MILTPKPLINSPNNQINNFSSVSSAFNSNF